MPNLPDNLVPFYEDGLSWNQTAEKMVHERAAIPSWMPPVKRVRRSAGTPVKKSFLKNFAKGDEG
jgi:hypothetical protein